MIATRRSGAGANGDGQRGRFTTIPRARLAPTRVIGQASIGFGDAIVPPPVWVEFLMLLDSPKPRLRAYPPETVIAEKLEAMVRLGLANGRMKDFFDMWHLARTYPFEGAVLADAVRATFAARGTGLPARPITALTPSFLHCGTGLLPKPRKGKEATPGIRFSGDDFGPGNGRKIVRTV